jgi:hypothetical protein
MTRHTVITLDEKSAFDTETGILTQEDEYTIDLYRIPRSGRLRITSYNSDTMYVYFMSGSRIVLELRLPPTHHEAMQANLLRWWLEGRPRRRGS